MKNKLWKLLNLHEGEEEQSKVMERVRADVQMSGSNLWILACAIIIASVGLDVNSTAVIIGAMLISPLMGPIVGTGFALATFDIKLLKYSVKILVLATFVSLLVSSIYFFVSPIKEVQSELLARTTPSIFDVLIALFGGIVGAISATRIEKGNPIPGVAIATALMPPLCTAGFGIANGNFHIFMGAFFLYCINCVFICIATFMIVKELKYKPVATLSRMKSKKIKAFVWFLTFIVIAPSLILAWQLLEEKNFTRAVEQFINTEFIHQGRVVIYKKIDYQTSPKTIDLAFLSKKFSDEEIENFNNKLVDYGINNTKLHIFQNTEDLRQEIINDITSNNMLVTQKELKIKHLRDSLRYYSPGDMFTIQKLHALFPDIYNIRIGLMENPLTTDSISRQTTLIYSSHQLPDTAKLRSWLELELMVNNVKLIRVNE